MVQRLARRHVERAVEIVAEVERQRQLRPKIEPESVRRRLADVVDARRAPAELERRVPQRLKSGEEEMRRPLQRAAVGLHEVLIKVEFALQRRVVPAADEARARQGVAQRLDVALAVEVEMHVARELADEEVVAEQRHVGIGRPIRAYLPVTADDAPATTSSSAS